MQLNVQTFQSSRGCREFRNLKLSAEFWLWRSVWECISPLKRAKISSQPPNMLTLRVGWAQCPAPRAEEHLGAGRHCWVAVACTRRWSPARWSPAYVSGKTATQLHHPRCNVQGPNNIWPRTFLCKERSIGLRLSVDNWWSFLKSGMKKKNKSLKIRI